jgi:hypothetical protein
MRILRQVTINDEKLEKFPFRRELSLQAYLMENEEILNLDEDTYCDVQIYDEEIVLKKTDPGQKDGRVDLIASYGSEYIAIIELKKNEINEDSLKQLEGYLKQRNVLLEKTKDNEIIETDLPSWIGVLVGDSISKNLEEKISNGYLFENEIPVAALTIERFKGNGNTYVITDTYFKNTSNSKDYTKYKFMNEVHNKRRLVLSVIQYFVAEKKPSNISEINKAFDMEGKSNPVVVPYEKAMGIYSDTGHKRHYIGPDEVIELYSDDKTIVAVNNQWGTGNIDVFLKRAAENGLTIETIHSSAVQKTR